MMKIRVKYKDTRKIKRILISGTVVLVAGVVLLLSVSRAGLEVVRREDREGRLRVEPVIINGRIVYQLPPSKLLPDNIFYIFKEIRDWTWLKFSSSAEDKVRVELILADKKMTEMRKLEEKGKEKLAFETGMEAIDKLKYASWLKEGIRDPNIRQEMTVQIRNAIGAYGGLIEEAGKKLEKNSQDYFLLKKKIYEFAKSQSKIGP